MNWVIAGWIAIIVVVTILAEIFVLYVIWKIAAVTFEKPLSVIYLRFLNSIDEHKQLAATMKDTVPVLSDTVSKISACLNRMVAIQDRQALTLDKLELHHSDHDIKLTEIKEILKLIKDEGPKDA